MWSYGRVEFEVKVVDLLKIDMTEFKVDHTVEPTLTKLCNSPVTQVLAQLHRKKRWLHIGRLEIIGGRVDASARFNDQFQLDVLLLGIQLEQKGLGIDVINIL